MGRRLAECGTWSAYKRHKRRGEDPCELCREAAKEQSRKQREKHDAKMKTFAYDYDGDTVQVVQIGAYGAPTVVDVPTIEDPLGAVRWRLHRVRAALLIAGTRDVAALAKAEQECMEEITALLAKSQPKRRSALDELAARRAQRSTGTEG